MKKKNSKIKNYREERLEKELNEFVKDLDGSETLADSLLRLMDEKALSAPQVYRRAELDRQVYNNLIQLRRPCRASKQTLLRICIGIEATEEEAKDLLATCGYVFEPALNNDRAYLFCIRKKLYDMYSVLEARDALDRCKTK